MCPLPDDDGALQDLTIMARFYHERAKSNFRSMMASMVAFGECCKADGDSGGTSPRLRQRAIAVYNRFFDYDQLDDSTWDRLENQSLEVEYQVRRACDPAVSPSKRWRARELAKKNVMLDFLFAAELLGKESS